MPLKYTNHTPIRMHASGEGIEWISNKKGRFQGLFFAFSHAILVSDTCRYMQMQFFGGTMKKVALYARTSTSEQNIDTQLIAIRDYCKRMSYTVSDEYIDSGFSGKDDKRTEFEHLLDDIRANKIDCVVVYKLDRIGRSLKHLLNLFEEFKNRGVEFISLTQNINTNTPEGKMFWQMLAVFAEYERELIVSRTMSGLERAVKQGKCLGRPQGSKDTKRRRKSGYIARWANNK